VDKPRKLVVGIIICFVAVSILLVAAILIAPKVVNTKTVRDKLRTEIKKISGVEVDFKHLGLDFFPHPRVIIDQVTLSKLPDLRGKAVSVSVQPKILPLFLAKIQIAGLFLDSGEIDYRLAKKPATEKIRPQPLSISDLDKKIQSVMSPHAEFNISGLDVQIKNSKANLFAGDRKILELTQVNSELAVPATGLSISLSCKSNLWQSISMNGSLKLSANPASTQNTPLIDLQIKGSHIDVAAVRETALELAEKNDFVQDIFDIVRGGSVPFITLTAQGNSLSDLADMDNIVIRGQMQAGQISIPDTGLDITDTSGEVVISQGILQGENLRARLGNSLGQNGRLKLGLIGDVAPFHLETDVRVDLSQLPPILKRLVGDKDFQQELARLKQLQGSANGKLVLGEDTDNVKVKVEASNIQLSAHYGRLPHGLQITGGNFSYDENRIGVSALSGKLGKSSFSDLSGSLGLGKKQDLEITSGKSGLHLAEIVPWLASFDKMHAVSNYYGGGKSIITLSQAKVKGPLFSPAKWNFNVTGDVGNLVIKNLPGRPGPLTIASAKFKADPQTFKYTDGQISMLDSVWKISGTHKNYVKGLDKDVRLTFEARLGSKSAQWFSDIFDVPDEIHIRPLTLSTSHLNYTRNGEKTISADLVLQDGLKISTALVLGSDKLLVKKLVIQDKASRANIGLSLSNKIFKISFKGNLRKTTLDRLMTDNPWLGGWLKGDFKAHIVMNHPLKSAVWGKLKGKKVIYPWRPGTPVKINDFALTASADKINLQSADIAFSGSRLHAAGNIGRSAKELLLDMDISAETVDLDPLIQALKNSNANNDPKTGPPLPLKGSIRFKIDRFNIGKFSWNPLHADINLNNDTADVRVKKADLCGISTPGTIKIAAPNVEFDIEAVAKDQELNPAVTCLVGGTFKAAGTYNLKGRFQGHGEAKDLLKTATGQVEFTAQDGHIYHGAILNESIEYLNTREKKEDRINVTDMKKKGFGYHSLRVKAKLQGGKLRYEEAVLHGQPMTLAAAGEQNLQNGQFDLTLLVAPLVTLDRFFEHIPLIGGILDTLDTIPLRVKGTLNSIHVYPLAPSAVGYGLAEMMKKTVERPINLIHGGKPPE
jgi:hypothetical protein